jgi:hypothetical protein
VSGQKGALKTSLCTDRNYLVLIDPVPGANSYQWIIPSAFTYSDGSSGTTTTTTNNTNVYTSFQTGYFNIKCNAYNLCGPSIQQKLTVNVKTCTTGNNLVAASVSAFPNPTASTLTVQVTDSLSTDPSTVKLEEPYELHLIDKYQRKVMSFKSSDKTLNISIEGIPSDTYYLHFYYKDAIIRKQIIIQK